MKRLPRILALLTLLILSFSAACQRAPLLVAGETLYPAQKKFKFGYINRKGEWVISPKYDGARPFSEGLAAVWSKWKWGYIDFSGKVVIPFQFDAAQEFHDGKAIVNSRASPASNAGLIDRNGVWVTPSMFYTVWGFSPEGLILADLKSLGPLAFYDYSGKLVYGPYEKAYPFNDGRACVWMNGEFKIIDTTGRVIDVNSARPEYPEYSEGLIAVYNGDRVGYMDVNGSILFELRDRVFEPGRFSEGLAAVATKWSGDWALIDKTGQIVAHLPPGAAPQGVFAEGLLPVIVPGGAKGFVNRVGQWAVQPVWDQVEPFSQGLAKVESYRREIRAYIDPTGKEVWTAKIEPLPSRGPF